MGRAGCMHAHCRLEDSKDDVVGSRDHGRLIGVLIGEEPGDPPAHCSTRPASDTGAELNALIG